MRSFKSSSATAQIPTDLVYYFGKLSQNTSADNLALGASMIQDEHRLVLQKYYFNETSAQITTVSGQQSYLFPYNYSTLKDVTVTVGALRWTPNFILTRQQWDIVNTYQYTSDIPQYLFIYDGKVQIFPIPSTTGNTITFNFKRRVPDLSLTDYVAGTVSVANGSATVTGASTAWVSTYLPSAGTVLEKNLWLRVTPPLGDNEWYQILSMEEDASLTLVQPYNGLDATGAAYSIGQMPVILEDFHDLLVYRPLVIYFSTIQPDEKKARKFAELREEGIMAMNNYIGEKVVNVDLGLQIQPVNPNLFLSKS